MPESRRVALIKKLRIVLFTLDTADALLEGADDVLTLQQHVLEAAKTRPKSPGILSKLRYRPLLDDV